MLTRRLRKNVWLAASAPVLCNAVIIGLVLHFTLADALLWPTIGSVGLGEAVVAYGLGVPLVLALRRIPVLREMCAKNEDLCSQVKKSETNNVVSSGQK